MRTPVLKARDPSPVSLTPELRATHALLHVFHDRLGTPRLRVLPAKGYTRERLPVFQLASLFPEPDSPSVRTLKLGLLEFGKGLSYVFTVPLDITPAGWLAYPLVEPIAYLLSRAIR
jgi:hypothetical protein